MVDYTNETTLRTRVTEYFNVLIDREHRLESAIFQSSNNQLLSQWQNLSS